MPASANDATELLFRLGQISKVRPIVMCVSALDQADGNALYTQPKHPYTGALLSAVPIADPNLAKTKQRIILEGDVPSPINPPSGCRFHPRCYQMKSLEAEKQERCRTDEPELIAHDAGHIAACHWPLDARIIEDLADTEPGSSE